MKVYIIVEYDDWEDTDKVHSVYTDKSKAEEEQKRLQLDADNQAIQTMSKSGMAEEVIRSKYLTHRFHIEEHDVK